MKLTKNILKINFDLVLRRYIDVTSCIWGGQASIAVLEDSV